MKRRRNGFSLVEIMVVMAIVGLLVSIALIEGVKFRKLANESNCQANLKAIASAFEVYSARNSGAYAPADESNLAFLVDAECLFQDLTNVGQIGNFRYVVGSVNAAGYDIRAMAVNPALGDHNYQIVPGGILRRTNTGDATDTDFKDF